MRLHRLIGILILIEAHGKIKAKELARAFEVSERTILRDIDVLCESGIPIASDTGPSGGYFLMDGYTINLNKLDCDDIISLYLSGIGVRPDRHSESNIKLKNAILKLEGSMPAQYSKDVSIVQERFYFDPNLWFREQQPIKHLDIIRKSVLKLIKLKIIYYKDSKNIQETTCRTVRPYGLVVKNMDWYLVAYCEYKQELRVFRCDRLIEVTTIDNETYTIPKDFVLDSFWNKWTEEFVSIIRANPS